MAKTSRGNSSKSLHIRITEVPLSVLGDMMSTDHKALYPYI